MKEYGENERKIAEFVYKEMCDGCCIQIGTGGVPTAIAALLAESDLKDLGVHTELRTDSIMMLEQKGLITGAKKSIQKGLMTTSILNGTAEFMEYVKENKEKFYMAPSDYVNDPHVVGQLDDFISVNGILEIDLRHGRLPLQGRQVDPVLQLDLPEKGWDRGVQDPRDPAGGRLLHRPPCGRTVRLY